MARKPRIWVQDSPRQQLPPEWCRAVEMPAHRSQGDVVIIAPTRATATEMLAEHGWDQNYAERFMRGMRTSDGRADDLVALTEAKVIDPDRPSIHLWWNDRPDQIIVRADPGGALVPVAHFRRAGRWDSEMYVEPITP